MDIDLDDSGDTGGAEAAPQIYALHNAAEAGDKGALEDILAAVTKDSLNDQEVLPEGELLQVDIDELDEDDLSPLHLAVLKGHSEATALLLARGASVKLTCEGSPAVHLAVCSGAHEHRLSSSLSILKLLLEHGALVTQRDDTGRTALHWAASLGLTQMLETLLIYDEAQAAQELARAQAARELARAQAANLETAEAAGQEKQGVLRPSDFSALMMQDRHGNTALHLAVSLQQSECCALLLRTNEGRAAASMTNKQLQFPIHLAAAQGCTANISQLLHIHPKAAAGRDKMGHTPGHWAKLCGFEEAAELLGERVRTAGMDHSVAPKRPHTVIFAPPACREHRTAPEPLVRGMDIPPENVKRLHVLTDAEDGILRCSEFGHLVWNEQNFFAPLADILRVHEWTYIRRIQGICAAIPDDPKSIGQLDPDTALSYRTWKAALAGVGACCRAIDQVVSGEARNAFCAIRPPGHHAGPLGTVTSANDPHGSQGFCFLNNVAIAASYAVNVHRHAGIRRVALLDFDVHHGNGTQACVARLVPQTLQYPVTTPLSEGSIRFHSFHPWLDEHDADNILFASVQGYGKKPTGDGGYVYPGSGATCDTQATPAEEQTASDGSLMEARETEARGHPRDDTPPDDPDLEFRTGEGEHPPPAGPRVINVGIPGPGPEVPLWRRAWRDKILPAVASFKPDLIILSAGFDAHKKDELNYRFIGLTERDYYWLTQQLVSLANTVCQGRLVSALEGGYRIQGGIVSAFARSVAAHVRALSEENRQVRPFWLQELGTEAGSLLSTRSVQEWRLEEGKRQRALELQRRRELLATRRVNALKAAERAAERQLERQAAAVAAHAAAPTQSAEIPLPATSPPAALVLDSLVETSSSRKRRRREPVDYAALNIRLQQEAKEANNDEKQAVPIVMAPLSQ